MVDVESRRNFSFPACIMKSSPGGVVSVLSLFIFCTLLSTAGAATLKVGAGGDFRSIGAAVGAASPGDTIEVYGGVYRERLSVDKKVKLSGRGRPVIDGGGENHVVFISAPYVIFEGFKVIGSGGNLATDDSGIYVEGTARGTIIRDNIVEDCAFGIWINGAKDVKVTGNHVIGRRELISQKRGNGIHLWNVRNGLVEGNEIEGARDGILISVTRKTLIKNNRIRDLRYGVHYMYADDNRVEGNVTFDTRAGLAIMFSKRLEIVSNYSYDNEEYGILFRDLFNSKVVDNVLAGNGKGLFLYNSLYNEIRGNIVAGNDIGSHVWAGSEENMVSENAFIRNRTQVKYVGMKDEDWSVEGRGNYWSDYLGWDLDGDGIGDVPYEANSVMERLVWTYPVVKLLLNSPAVQTLRMVERQFPVMKQPSIIDSAPLMRPTTEDWRKWIDRSAD